MDDKNKDIPQNLYSEKTIRLDNTSFQDMVSPMLKGSLLVISGSPADIGNHILIQDKIIIGRDPSGLFLRDGRISRRHVMVKAVDNSYFVEDLGSMNGTCLNGKPLNEAIKLKDGDKIILGHTIIKFMLIDETEANYLKNIQHLAGIDQLTGLPAKHRFDSLLQETIKNAHINNTPLSVMMMDMDGLKSINDKHGHQMGAYTISRVGQIIGNIIKGKGEATRFGGDEFCAMLPMHDINSAMKVGEQIRLMIENTAFTLQETTVRATISIGTAELNDKTQTENDILALADQALYRSKAKGRNNVSN